MKNIQVRVTNKMKEKADKLFNDLGTTTNEAIKMFLQASLNNNGFPFEVKKPEPDDLLQSVKEHMLPITDEQLNNTFIHIESSKSQWDDFESGMYLENVLLKGNPYEDEEIYETLAEVMLCTINGKEIVDVGDAADSYSGDVYSVVNGMINRLNIPSKRRIAVMDEYFIYTEDATSETRINLFKKYIIPYLKDLGIQYLGFVNAGMWHAESRDSQLALEKAMESLNIIKAPVLPKEKWDGQLNVIKL
ncbi:type II toxin-antitoxin system RelB/DinJ family antitoxin [Lactobacillus sp.]|uniref:type II toxin-antitoxin system RelB/DinJ family antitoxin n=1 Tax=Lactobacillus sp. TaxID=1591 RepID=UPI0019BC4923|nr:type II toxin-antitoxin system RelB/DinJ family antitoxin [Lactobacillus sp.]MBD5430736.1 type II toxin-antitoxin system RelB/DinJ family antitoxin [Lactobacillus sp.]